MNSPILQGKNMMQTSSNSISDLQQESDKGNAQAQFELALCHANGNDVVEDMTHAIKLCEKAAESGDANAQFVLRISLDPFITSHNAYYVK